MSRPALLGTFLFSLLIALVGSPALPAAEITIKPQHDGVDPGLTILVDGKLFCEYWVNQGAKPFLWPIIGPHGIQMTRDYPMKYVDGEKHDHPHQRSFWFTYGNVNGLDFWTEFGEQRGRTVHREFVEKSAKGNTATIVTRNDWLGPDDKKHLEDERRIVLRADGDARIIDFDITLKATAGDVVFGDTKEGAFGIRIPTKLDVDPEKNKPRAEGEGGHIVNSDGLTDKDAWGKPARWVDYHGPLEGRTVGVAILNHPSSFRFPTRWHVRTYGLFAANPFGVHDFEPGSKETPYTLVSGEELALRYRVIFHEGDHKQADIEGAFQKYAAEK